MKFKLLLISFLLYIPFGFAQFQKARFQVNGFDLPYQVSFPENYDSNKQYPLILFLHGAGERGNDNEKQLTHGKDFLLNNTQKDFPAIVIAPQCSENSYWSNVKIHFIDNKLTFKFGLSDTPTPAMDAVMMLLKDWLSSGKVNLSQVYVGGLSMGGMGTFELLWRMPNTFAGAFPICGGSDPGRVNQYAKNTAVWIFHGDSDNVVSVECSRMMYEALKKSGNETNVKYTEYKGVYHNSWDNVFKEKDFFKWLFEQKLGAQN